MLKKCGKKEKIISILKLFSKMKLVITKNIYIEISMIFQTAIVLFQLSISS